MQALIRYKLDYCNAVHGWNLEQLIHWVISLVGLVPRSAKSLSETAVTHRPQGVIIVGIYMSSNIYYYYYYHRQ